MEYVLLDFEDVTVAKLANITEKNKSKSVFKLLLQLSSTGQKFIAVQSVPIPLLENKTHGMRITLRASEIHFNVILLHESDVISIQPPAESSRESSGGQASVEAPVSDMRNSDELRRALNSLPVVIFAVVRAMTKCGEEHLIDLDDGLKVFRCRCLEIKNVGHAGFFEIQNLDRYIWIREVS